VRDHGGDPARRVTVDHYLRHSESHLIFRPAGLGSYRMATIYNSGAQPFSAAGH